MRLKDLGSTLWVRRLGWASLVANIVIVLTGGAVRLSDSGLGCPTWPRCTEESMTPHGALDEHSAIEFGNRMLTFVLAAIAIATFVAAHQHFRATGRRDLRNLALVMAIGVPAQAVIGGITVLTDLNPWVVSFHLLCSMAIIAVAVLFLWRVDRPVPELPAVPGRRRPVALLGWLTFAAAWLVLYVGTVVTGSGPHAGDAEAPRNGLDPLQVSQLHADVVFLLLGLSIGLAVVARTRSAYVLLGVEGLQGVVGFVQYFNDLPELLVALHLLGAAVLSAVVTWALLEARET